MKAGPGAGPAFLIYSGVLCHLIGLPVLLDDVLAKYKAKNVIWAQEEPENMGAWAFMAMNYKEGNLIGICRPASAASAEGSKKLHEKRLENLYTRLFSYAKI